MFIFSRLNRTCSSQCLKSSWDPLMATPITTREIHNSGKCSIHIPLSCIRLFCDISSRIWKSSRIGGGMNSSGKSSTVNSSSVKKKKWRMKWMIKFTEMLILSYLKLEKKRSNSILLKCCIKIPHRNVISWNQLAKNTIFLQCSVANEC